MRNVAAHARAPRAMWWAATGEPETIEQSMMEFSSHPAENSRLACQITVTKILDGLVVRIPESQG